LVGVTSEHKATSEWFKSRPTSQNTEKS